MEKTVKVLPPTMPNFTDFDTNPIAPVLSIHVLGFKTNELNPACCLKWSNSTTLELALCIVSHPPQLPRKRSIYY